MDIPNALYWIFFGQKLALNIKECQRKSLIGYVARDECR